jgi:2-dehydro-3-deoxyphosphooctonate aldolase (KDO 8-P synthase)
MLANVPIEPHPLAAWRKQRDRTLVELAAELGCAPSHLSQIESRKTNPSLALIAKLKAISGGALAAEDFLPAEAAPAARAVVAVGKIKFGNELPLKVIAGPCALESREHALEVAGALARIAKRLKLGLVYKTSFDKANRTSAKGARGVGLDKALPIFAEIRERTGLPVLTDVHEPEQCARLAEVVDVLQIPAFLCRQTDLLVAAAKTGRVINVKKGQFLAPWDMKNVVDKITGAGNRNVLVTERGASFGYNTLVSDMRSLPILARTTGAPVVFDATHSVQQPGGRGTASGGEREFVPVLARAAVAVGVAAVFIETHPDPDHAPSDGPNMVPLKEMEGLLSSLIEFDSLTKRRKTRT